jgi:DDE superfamily endonuclease
MNVAYLPALWQDLLAGLASFLHQRLAWRLAVLLGGALFAQRRRTVTSWLRAASGGPGFAAFYYALAAGGRRTGLPAGFLLQGAVPRFAPGGPLLFAVDDTPAPRYGPEVPGAGLHHNPAPGPTDQRFLYGHVWVALSWVVQHPLWGTLGLPVRAVPYVRRKDVPRLPKRHGWTFRTKLELAAELLTWAAGLVRFLGRTVRCVADGFYAERPFLKAAAAAGVVVISRLRRDAGLRTLPVPPRAGRRRRGRPPVYGRGRISLAKRAGQQRGWQEVPTRQYGEVRTKRIKTVLATWRPAGGVSRVVLVRAEHGWLALFSTDPTLTAPELLSAAAERFSIEQNFHDLKEVEGAGQQQVRDLGANVGAFHLSLWAHTLVELWAWDQPRAVLGERTDSPWDDPARRPSHADRRKALQRHCLEQEFQQAAAGQPLTPEIQEFVGRVIRHAA